MSADRMYLDGEAGLSPTTSHPRFVELAPESFYDSSNPFAPFGSDDGNDAFRDLEAWYETFGPDADVREFLTDLLAGWEYEIPPHIIEASDEEVLAWINEDDMNEVHLGAAARARVSAALGMLKIVGRVTSEIAAQGHTGVRLQRIMAADTTRYPNWPHRGAALRGLAEIENVLHAADDAR